MNYETTIHIDQFPFQFANSTGRILNVGSNTDGAGLRKHLGAINVDLRKVDHVTGEQLPVDIIADARDLTFDREFDTVVLGEILEHMEGPDAVMALESAYRALVPGGRVVITMPHDGRRDGGNIPEPEGDKKWYADGIYAYHYRNIGLPELLSWISQAGFQLVRHTRIHYLWGERGSGIIAIKPEVRNA